jgi:hypothetical protein
VLCVPSCISLLNPRLLGKYQIIHSGGLTILLKLTSAPGNPPYKPHAARGLANLVRLGVMCVVRG